jgi:DegV family protein with EDD domain
MAYQIITDTCCDFPAQMYDQLGVTVVPLSVLYKGVNYDSYTEQWLKDLYEGLRSGETASTCAINPEQWASYMEPALKEGKDALVLSFSSGLSTTYQSAVIAADELREKYPDRQIRVVDTLCASLGQGLFVYYACQKRDAGLSLDELTAWCEETKMNLCHWVIADDLMYLKRGGRVSAASAVAGTLLQIKPLIHMDNARKLIPVGKIRGRKAAIKALCDKVGETGIDGANDTIFICHGDCEEDAKTLEGMLKEKYGTKNVFYYYIGAVIGSHAGPGTMAIFYLGKER